MDTKPQRKNTIPSRKTSMTNAINGDCPMNSILQQVQQHSPASQPPRREELATALEQAAAINPFGNITDPVAWQREQRQDRPLPGRPYENDPI